MKSKSWLKNFVVKLVLSCALLFISVCMYAQPVARFSGTTLSGCAPILVHFTDESAGNPNYWKWDLGDGTISYLQNPSVTYLVPGIYSIKLLVKNAVGEDSVIKTNYVQVYAAPVVNFTASQTTSCNSIAVNFTNQSNSGNAWLWDIGDGVFSTQQNPSHTYSQTGSYNVSLRVTNSDGCTATLLRQGYITVNTAKAGFVHSVPDRCKPTQLGFQNNSSGNGRLLYKWFFGNGDSSAATNPVYVYPTGGSYTVKLIVTNQFGCEDVFTENIIVQNPVSAAFTADITNSCKSPVAIHFSNQVLNGNTYTWRFGDSSIVVASNPVHVFTDTGNYIIRLVVKNTNGCIDSLVKTNFIHIQKPFVNFENLPDSGCAPFNKKLSVVTNGSDSIVNYLWRFDNGETSGLVSPNHIFNGQGYHAVTLITTGLSGCKDTATIQNAIRISTRPVADFSADTRIGCAQGGIHFTNLSTGGATAWVWEFGDNSQAVDQHPEHRFTDTGFLMVRLIAYNGGCADTMFKPNYVYIKPAVSKFKYDVTCANPFLFSFNNFSLGADNWQWDFGDGVTSTELNPMHLYRDTGEYSVSLSTNNLATGCGYYKSKFVRVVKITPGFYAADSVLCKNGQIRFTATPGATEVNRFIWDFGDGNFDNTHENYVDHIYEQPGNYTVRLITINLVNCRDTVIKTNYISVHGLKAKFSAAALIGCANTQIAFHDSSLTNGSNSIQSWQWNFGDGHIETNNAPPFQHTYANRGNFLVSLKITDNKGCSDSYTMDTSMAIKKVSAFFGASDTAKCSATDLRFICPYAEPGVSYRWDFGDGNSAYQQSPYHQYAQEGLYTVKLHVAQFGCEDSSTRTNFIRIEDAVSTFTISDSFRTCPPLIAQFTNLSLNATEERWDFGDGSTTTTHNPSHFYSYPGTYTISLTVKGRGNCNSRMQKQVIVKGPKGSMAYTPLNFCKPSLANFIAHTTDAVSYLWDFNDGNTVINNDSVVTHQYSNTGKYFPKLILTDNNGCKVPISGTDTINLVNLVAAFEFPGNTVCSADQVAFVNKTKASEPVVSNRWSFGDGFFANSADPAHDYQVPGTYYPSLIVTSASGCVDSLTAATPVIVAAAPNAGIQVLSGAAGCIPLAASFSGILNSTAIPAVKWQWDFGNGNTSLQQNPPAQNYTDSGSHVVTLSVTSSQGCEKIFSKIIEAYPSPKIQFTGSNEICKGSSTTLTVSGAASYSWNPAAGLNCTSCTAALVTPAVNTVYHVTGVGSNGCVARDSVTVKVVQPFNMSFSNSVKSCAGKPVTLAAAGAQAYEWSPSNGLSDVHSASPVAQPAANITYRVIGAGEKGCFKDTGFVTLNINALPVVNAGTDKNIVSGTATDLVPTVSADVTAVRWSPTDAVFRNSGNDVTVKPTATTEYTIEVKNAAGCMATDKVMVTVTSNAGGDIFIPNTFSPNGDGANEIFYPRSAGSIKINRLKVLNREGVTVFEKNNFYTNDVNSGWDGTLRGVKLISDVYVYAVEITDANGKPHIISGNVSLVR